MEGMLEVVDGLLPIDADPFAGIETLPDNDFFAFLGDLSTDPPAQLQEAVVPAATAVHHQLLPVELAATTAAALHVPQCNWQVTTGLQAHRRQASKGSSCSSETGSALASASEALCPDSPVLSSSPASSSDAARPAPSSDGSAGGPARKRQRTQTQQQVQSSSVKAPVQQQEPADVAASQEEQQPEQQLTRAQLAAAKRRAPVVDWKAIDDPEERRRQRRLAKNRVTAARSRERKKELMADMEQRLAQMEAENKSMRALMQNLVAENTSLKEQLASLNRGATASPTTQGSGPEPAVLVKCVAIMHLVCCLILCAKASLGLVLLLLPVMMQSEVCSSERPVPSGVGRSCVSAQLASCAVAASSRAVVPSVQGSDSWQIRQRVRLRNLLVGCC